METVIGLVAVFFVTGMILWMRTHARHLKRELETAAEGCLSLPGVHVEVERALAVRVRAKDERGEDLDIEAEGLDARIIQHELDHLDGILVLDRISREARKEAMRAMREAQKAQSAA